MSTQDYEALEKEWQKKAKDVEKRGIASTYWKEVLDIIKYLESKEEYERCQDLWDYYKQMTGGK